MSSSGGGTPTTTAPAPSASPSSSSSSSLSQFWHDYQATTQLVRKKYVFISTPFDESIARCRELLARQKNADTAQFGAFCSLAIARCEQAMGVDARSSISYVEAGNRFWECEREQRTIFYAGLEEHCTEAIHCYLHAINIHIKRKEYQLVGALYFELGSSLMALQRESEAVEYFLHSAEVNESICPVTALAALDDALTCCINLRDFKCCKRIIVKAKSITARLHSRGLRHELLLADALLVLMLLSIVEGRHKDATWVLEQMPQYMHSDTVSLLYDFAMAANQRDIDTILLMMDDLCTVLNDRHHTLVAAITDQIQHDLS